MPTFRAKIFEVEACRWDGMNDVDVLKFLEFEPRDIEKAKERAKDRKEPNEQITIAGRDGVIVMSCGDYLIKNPPFAPNRKFLHMPALMFEGYFEIPKAEEVLGDL